jgi:hypothetical protein
MLARDKRDPTGPGGQTPTLPKSTSRHEESLTDAEKVAFVGLRRNYHFDNGS